MFLNEVVLGNEWSQPNSDASLVKPPSGYNSIVGRGVPAIVMVAFSIRVIRLPAFQCCARVSARRPHGTRYEYTATLLPFTNEEIACRDAFYCVISAMVARSTCVCCLHSVHRPEGGHDADVRRLPGGGAAGQTPTAVAVAVEQLPAERVRFRSSVWHPIQ